VLFRSTDCTAWYRINGTGNKFAVRKEAQLPQEKKYFVNFQAN